MDKQIKDLKRALSRMEANKNSDTKEKIDAVADLTVTYSDLIEEYLKDINLTEKIEEMSINNYLQYKINYIKENRRKENE